MDMQTVLQNEKALIFDEMREKFDLFRALILEYNQKYNLTTILDKKEMFYKHFLDSAAGVDLFFENAMQFAEVYCAKSDEKIISALYLIGAHLNGKKAHYIFGVATLPEFRGRGIMGNLMEYALNDAKQNGDVYSLLFPANEKLYDFYAKFGYKANCTAKSRAFTRN